MTSAIIIDTHIFVWFMEGTNNLSSKEIKLINKIINSSQIIISAISFWEIAMLEKLKKISISIPIKDWINKAISQKGIKIAGLDIDILIESVYLPGNFHKDPADRMIVATSRIKEIPLLTHDTRIIKYGQEGHVQLIKDYE